MQRAESYLQHDTTSKWDVLTFFAATFPISWLSDIIDIGRQDGELHWRGVVVFLYLSAATFTTEECSWRNV